MAPRILKLRTSCTPRERAPGTHWMGGWIYPRAVFLDAVAKRKIPYQCRQSNTGRPSRSLVTILTELPRLRCEWSQKLKYIYMGVKIRQTIHGG